MYLGLCETSIQVALVKLLVVQLYVALKKKLEKMLNGK